MGIGGDAGEKTGQSSPAGEVLPVLLALTGAVLLRVAAQHQRQLWAVGTEQRVLLRLLVLLQAATRLLAKTWRWGKRKERNSEGGQRRSEWS